VAHSSWTGAIIRTHSSQSMRIYSEAVVLSLVEHIYDAAVVADRWPSFLDRISVVTGSVSPTLWRVANQPAGELFASATSSYEWMPDYLARFVAVDPWVPAISALGAWRDGFVGLGEAAVPMSVLKKTEFYNELGRKHGLIGGFASLVMSRSGLLALTTHQPAPGTFGSREVELARALVPHLRRALVLHEHLSELESRHAGAIDVIDTMRSGVILIDARGQVEAVNRAARALLGRRDGLYSAADGLRAGRAAETQRLRQLVHAALGTTTGTGMGAGGDMTVSRLHKRNDWGEHGRRAGAIVIVHDPDQRPELDADVLRRIYGFSAAEVRVAGLLVAGRSVRDIAALLRVEISTVRTHVSRLLAKSGTSTQAQLVAVLLGSPAVIAEKD
jgi:DNA-binding CsgD family transcriptional regulator/PAS domain-containing protein